MLLYSEDTFTCKDLIPCQAAILNTLHGRKVRS